MSQPLNSFHNIVDIDSRAYQSFVGSNAWKALNDSVTRLDRSVEYQFFAHFHPYVAALIRRLNEGGFASLQEADTLYLPQPNNGQPLTVMPGSTRATLGSTVTAKLSDGTSVTLTSGTPVTLQDGVLITIPAGATVGHPDGTTSRLSTASTMALPGLLPASSSSGIQWLMSGVETILPDATSVTLPNGANAILTGGGTAISIPNGTAVAIRSGLPQPFYYEGLFDSSHYNPDPTSVRQPFPVKNIDFSFDGAYSIYNWELFFHAPLLIATHLSQNQRFQDAQTWFHYIFNPSDNSAGPTPERFWKVQPFQYTDVTMIEEILVNLSTNQDPQLFQATVDSISNWKQNPFQPFAVAKFRPTSYMLKTVMAYLDNLIAWGDSLFQQYTIETISEATQLYIMAANILGPKPQAVPKKGSAKTLAYRDLRGKLDDFDNTMVGMEADIPFDIAALPGPGIEGAGTKILASIGQTLYFCIPRNDKLLGYWETVADRLFKIHNSLNLRGVFQRLPLYDPPVDPALLVRAAAAGLDVSAIVSGLNQPLPLVRFAVLISKAAEICQEVKSLGANLLAAIEKQDGESLALMRAQHESAILKLSESVKYAQWQDTVKATQGLQQSLSNAVQRYSYYQKLLGRTDAQITSSVPVLSDLDLAGLLNLNFTQTATDSEPMMGFDSINPDITADSITVSDGEVRTITTHEAAELSRLESGRDAQVTAGGLEALGSVLAILPQFGVNFQPVGVGATTGFGGQQLHSMMSALASAARVMAEESSFEGARTSRIGSYSRRELEWTLNSNSAKGEINQVFKQLRGAQIREAIARKEYDNHQKAMAQAERISQFLEGTDVGGGFQIKETTMGFYAWMKREVKALHVKAFQLAFEVAKKAERTLQNDFGDPSLTHLQFNYLDGTEGLLAGEKLMLDIRAMEMAYHDLNEREYELTKHASLLQVDPLALVQLRATGMCTFTLPEELFDLDGPGHFFRRTRSVAITVPCVTGPYTSVNCTLTLQKSSVRTTTGLGDGYARKGSDDPRFSDYYGTLQSIVTSSAQSDSGLFETNSRDERYLPFEGTGVAGSEWQLTLPSDVRQFDFDTISDVLLHVRYTAREGGDAFRAAAVQNLQHKIDKAQTVGSVRLMSVRHEFPTEWARFRSVNIGGATETAALSLTLLQEHYPFWAQGIAGAAPLKAVALFAEMTDGNIVNLSIFEKADKSGKIDSLNQNPALGNLLTGSLLHIPRPRAVSDRQHPQLTLYFDQNSMKNLWLTVTWGKG